MGTAHHAHVMFQYLTADDGCDRFRCFRYFVQFVGATRGHLQWFGIHVRIIQRKTHGTDFQQRPGFYHIFRRHAVQIPAWVDDGIVRIPRIAQLQETCAVDDVVVVDVSKGDAVRAGQNVGHGHVAFNHIPGHVSFG